MLSGWGRWPVVPGHELLSEDLAAGRLVPVVAESFPFDRAADAHRFIHERRNVGKVVLVP